MFKKYVEQYKDEIIKTTQELIKIPSVNSESTSPDKPFGEEANNALLYFLHLAKKLGFKTKNVDGYCGYIEFGEGEELLGIIGHLDVVPKGDNWTFPPFEGVISDGKIYGRGAIDDKGPVVASLYAMKIVKDNFKINKRVRLIVGINEELDWKCINYYKKHEELPTISFSPDADFPCIYAEKSILTCFLNSYYEPSENDLITIDGIDCNKNAINVVPNICSVILKTNKLSMEDFIKEINKFITNLNYEIDIYKIDNHTVKLTSYGIASHAAHPNLGKNAISQLIVLLNNLFKFYNLENTATQLFDLFTKYINTQFNGKNLEIDFKDESGPLTLNVGNFSFNNNILKIGMNLRVPVTIDINIIKNAFLKSTDLYEHVNFEVTNYMPALYVSKDDYLVKTLCKIYNEETNSNLSPIAIGRRNICSCI